jgi:hypothetical protein
MWAINSVSNVQDTIDWFRTTLAIVVWSGMRRRKSLTNSKKQFKECLCSKQLHLLSVAREIDHVILKRTLKPCFLCKEKQ